MKTPDLNPVPVNPKAVRHSRRKFLADTGRGTLPATVGSALARELGLAPPAPGQDGPEKLAFGEMEPLVAFMQETALTDLQPAMAAEMKRRPARFRDEPGQPMETPMGLPGESRAFPG